MSYQVQGGRIPHQALHSGSDPTPILEFSFFRRDGILQVSKNQGKVWVSMLLCLHARSCPCPLTVVGGTLVGRLPPCQSHQLG